MSSSVLIARNIVLNNLGPQFQSLINCKLKKANGGQYAQTVKKYPNVITWGMKLPMEWYQKYKQKNFLFIENKVVLVEK